MIKKFIQLLMVLAVFNPFCCCTAGVFTVDEGDAATVAHSCCQSQSSDLPASGDGSNDGHDPEQCPHQALKEYQTSLVKDDASALHAVSLLPALFLVFDLVSFELVAQSSFATHNATISHTPPLSLAQVYCVYRI